MGNALAVFAFARIAEDEEIAREEQEGVTSMRDYEPREWALAWVDDQTWDVTALSISTTRVLAECRAKRIIVNRYVRAIETHDEASQLSHGMLIAYEAVVRDLVSVWSDHPDYDDDWSF